MSFRMAAYFKTDGPLFFSSSLFPVLGEGGWGRREGDNGDLTVYGGCGGSDDDGDGDTAACG